MSKAKRLSACAVSVLALSALAIPAHAQTSRIYMAGYFGLNTFYDQEFSDGGTGRSGSIKVDNAMSFAGALGFRLSSQLRLEGELSYRNADLASIDVDTLGSFNTGGQFKSTILFANAYYDFDVPWAIQPYIGGGLGYGWHEGQISNGVTSTANDDDASIMWNIGGGLKYRLSPSLAFTGSYRYVDSFDLDIGNYEVDYDTHEFRLGMEWDLPIN